MFKQFCWHRKLCLKSENYILIIWNTSFFLVLEKFVINLLFKGI
ncbi:hypothetical protein HMPREF3180_01391 [Leptotrichia wadei]|uniref:Uncharacterized protein n=1 Tax=Leptotrichia wadei TaxID=157687 RepID=A0A134AA42_9FUSO|nr:hypothetical protein HMPREF3180_01391 [Leptotrichia wadei]